MEFPPLADLAIDTLGPCKIESPMSARRQRFVDESDRVLAFSRSRDLDGFDLKDPLPSFEAAGARQQIFFDPAETTCGIVSCGGLCPGINNVVRSLTLSLHHGYGVRRILGFRYGFAGVAGDGEVPPPIELTPDLVEPIHKRGGSALGSSRGPQDISLMVDNLIEREVDLLFTIGGDGTLRGARELTQEIARRGLDIGVIGVPKTIDNDIQWIERSFGFATAVEEARQVIVGAHAEARGAWNGIGLVKLMGRHAGFIAAHASLANSDVNFCLVPEVPFSLEGDGGFLEALTERLRISDHAVIVVAEGAGQELFIEDGLDAHDPSGNLKLRDIGPFLKQQIRRHLSDRGMAHTIKYIDPSYIVRSMPANSMDAQYCLVLGQHAAHAGMAGRTNMVVGFWGRHFTHVPIDLAVDGRKHLTIGNGGTWQRVLEATGQPSSMVGR